MEHDPSALKEEKSVETVACEPLPSPDIEGEERKELQFDSEEISEENTDEDTEFLNDITEKEKLQLDEDAEEPKKDK